MCGTTMNMCVSCAADRDLAPTPERRSQVTRVLITSSLLQRKSRLSVRYAIRCLMQYGKRKFQHDTEVIWRDMP